MTTEAIKENDDQIGRSTLVSASIELVVDPVDEAIEELSLLTQMWQKNRDRNRPSPKLRGAIITAAGELRSLVELLKAMGSPDTMIQEQCDHDWEFLESEGYKICRYPECQFRAELTAEDYEDLETAHQNFELEQYLEET